MIKTCDIYWLAGFLEGEGSFCISINNTHKGSHGLNTRSYVVTASQNEREPLDKAQSVPGGTICFTKPCDKRPRGFYRWSVSTRRAIGAMMMLYQLMSSKRKREILSAITDWKFAPRLGDYMRKKTHCPLGHPYDEENTVRLACNRRGCRLCRRQESSRRAALRRKHAHGA